ncbi:MAG TPA: FAD-dependent oxidoreductase, partial [Thermotogota bacterium]|nr:FAD-dependent oxidoreductase [Thermotogota bacterium]
MRVAVIGAGVVGSLIARCLTRYRCEVHIFEKEEDVGWGITKANSAVIHGGYDDPPGSVRARFCAKGNAMYSSLSEELGFELKRIGSFVLVQAPEDFPYLETLKAQALDNGLSGCA